MQVGQAQRAQVVTGLVVQAAQTLDAVDLARHTAEHRRLVPTASANLQHPPHAAIGLHQSPLAQQLNHARHHAGLGNGLPQTNGQAGVLVSLGDQGRIDKLMARHLAHGREHFGVAQAALHQFAHHARTHRRRVQTQARGQRGKRGRLGAFWFWGTRWVGGQRRVGPWQSGCRVWAWARHFALWRIPSWHAGGERGSLLHAVRSTALKWFCQADS